MEPTSESIIMFVQPNALTAGRMTSNTNEVDTERKNYKAWSTVVNMKPEFLLLYVSLLKI